MPNLDAFAQLGLDSITLSALAAKGFEEPSPIQAATIPLLLDGSKDVIGQAQTGTGKTAAFGIPIIQTITPNMGYPQAIILSPTRELCIQIAEEMNSLRGSRMHSIAPIYGGQSIDIQLRRLRQGVDIVVGTPGRVIDLIERHALDISRVSYAILDEADEMLNMGFVEDIEKILQYTPEQKRTLMFSATMPKPILTIAEKSMREYELIKVAQSQMTSTLTDQIYFEVRNEDKFEALTRIIDMEQDMFAMVFCRTKVDVDQLAEKLNFRGYLVEALHGDIAQAQRTRVIERFKAKKFNLLLATDVAARGIDVSHLTHVVNYSIPQGPEAYVHRIGRTGRAGNTGTAITFVTPSEFRKLTYLKREVKGDIRKEELPNPESIVSRKKSRIVERIQKVIEGEREAKYVAFAEEILAEITPEKAIAALLRMAYKTELMPESYNELSSKRPKKDRVDDRGLTRLFIALGKDQNYGPKALLDLLWERAKVKKSKIGKIDCFDKFSFINAPFEEAERLIEAFRGFGHKGGTFIEIAKSSDDKTDKKKRKKSDIDGMPDAPKSQRELPSYDNVDYFPQDKGSKKGGSKPRRNPVPSWEDMRNSDEKKARKRSGKWPEKFEKSDKGGKGKKFGDKKRGDSSKSGSRGKSTRRK